MLSDAEVDALVAGQHRAASAVLGLHADAHRRLWVRAMLPCAARVEVVAANTGRRVGELALRHPAGLWEGVLPRRRKRFDYRLRVRWVAADPGGAADPPTCAPLIADADLQQLQRGEHLRAVDVLGALPLAVAGVAGVRFALWAPDAQRVSVVGDFNGWDGRRHALRARDGGVWEIFVPQVLVGARYQFEVVGRADVCCVADPYARAVEPSPGTASVVAALPSARTPLAGRASANDSHSPIAIYEVHAASWRRRADGSSLTWDELADALPVHAVDLGFTHVELLPIHEHRLDGTPADLPVGLYAPSAHCGPPEGFTRFVAACHARGLGVLLDWVPDPGPARAPAARECPALREGARRDQETAGDDFDRPEVINYLVGNALYWIERHGVDGLRVDALASVIYRGVARPSGQRLDALPSGRENRAAIAFLQRVNEVLDAECAGAITVAEESTAFPGVSARPDVGGLGFDFKWNVGWIEDSLEYMHQPPDQRRWHHDKMSFGLVYAFTERYVLPLSHGQLRRGKGSMVSRMPGDPAQRWANLRAYYGFMWGHPGKKLLFMGQEFAQAAAGQPDAALASEQPAAERHAGVMRLVRVLNRLYRALPALHRLDCERGGFEWIDAHDAERSLYSWLRRDGAGGVVLVVSNLGAQQHAVLRLGVPHGPARWREVLNTDATEYGGSGLASGGDALPVQAVASHGHEQSITLTMPPLATLFLVPA